MKGWEELLSWRLVTPECGHSECVVPIGDMTADLVFGLVGRINAWPALHFPSGTLLISSIEPAGIGMDMKVCYAPYGWNTAIRQDYIPADFRVIPDIVAAPTDANYRAIGSR